MSINSLINSVRSYLESNYMFVEPDWLSGCVEYLTEDSGGNYSISEIQNLAKEQLLLNDLKDICPGSLPANLKNQHKTVLNGRHVLQINAAIDIGTPAYQQYLKLQKVNMENVEATTNFEDKISNHRMIKLYMTDGAQEISGIEYRPMRNLSIDIQAGSKVLIKGPVECRRGVLLLTESSIELLGGEVQEILISNSLAGLLSSKLGLPITQECPDINPTMPPRNTHIPAPHTHIPNQPTFDQTSRPVARVTSLQVAHNFDEDIDMDQLAALEGQITHNPAKRSRTDDNVPPEKKLKVNTSDDYPNEDDISFEDEEYLREIEAKFDAQEIELNTIPRPANKGPINVPTEPYVYIKQINDLTEGAKLGRVFRVKGQILRLLSKLSVGKDGWSLRCTIVDGTGSIDVEFTSDVLSKLVGYTPQEMNQIKKEMATKPELKERAVLALQKAKDSLQVLYCIIELTMLEIPKITKLIPFEQCHAEQLKKRLQATGL